jgi:hypothetical protein
MSLRVKGHEFEDGIERVVVLSFYAEKSSSGLGGRNEADLPQFPPWPVARDPTSKGEGAIPVFVDVDGMCELVAERAPGSTPLI